MSQRNMRVFVAICVVLILVLCVYTYRQFQEPNVTVKGEVSDMRMFAGFSVITLKDPQFISPGSVVIPLKVNDTVTHTILLRTIPCINVGQVYTFTYNPNTWALIDFTREMAPKEDE